MQRNINSTINLNDLDGHLQCFAVVCLRSESAFDLVEKKQTFRNSERFTLERPLDDQSKS